MRAPFDGKVNVSRWWQISRWFSFVGHALGLACSLAVGVGDLPSFLPPQWGNINPGARKKNWAPVAPL